METGKWKLAKAENRKWKMETAKDGNWKIETRNWTHFPFSIFYFLI
jgi:hypothetical protein